VSFLLLAAFYIDTHQQMCNRCMWPGHLDESEIMLYIRRGKKRCGVD